MGRSGEDEESVAKEPKPSTSSSSPEDYQVDVKGETWDEFLR